jgi:hypothetical protein
VGLLALGVQAGLLRAAEPAASPVTDLPALWSAPLATAPAPHVPLGDTPCAACCESICNGKVLAGVGLYLIQPYFENNTAYNFLAETGVNGNTVTLATDRVNVSHHLDVAPLIWLGYETADGFGGRVRYWYLDEGTSQTVGLAPYAGTATIKTVTNPSPPPATIIQPAVNNGTLFTLTSATPLGLQAFGDTLSITNGKLVPESTVFTVTTQLEVQVLDLEVFQHLRCGVWDFLFSGGVRLAQLNQTYNAYDNQNNNPAELRTLASSYHFNGAGPVLALEIRRALGCSGLTAYGSGRGSLVIGSATQNASFGGPTLRNDDPNPQFASQHWERGLPIGELEFGVEYKRQVGPLELCGQIALVGQDWFGAGNASRSQGTTPNPATPSPVVGGAPVDSDIGFFGLALRFGVDY